MRKLSKIGGGVRVIPYENVLEEMTNLKRYKFTISMRFHALVLSLLADVPSVPIAYGEKTYLLSIKSGLSEYALTWNCFQKEYYGCTRDMTADELIQKSDLLLSNYAQIREDILYSTKELKQSAKTAMKQLIDLVEDNQR